MSIHGSGFNSNGGGFLTLLINGVEYPAEQVERCIELDKGKPFGWYWTLRNKDDAIIEDGIIVNDGDDYAVQPDWIPLYHIAPKEKTE